MNTFPTEPDPTLPPGPSRRSATPFETFEQERTTLTRLVRLVFIVLFFSVAILAMLNTEGGVGTSTFFGPGGIALKPGWNLVLSIGFALAVSVFVIDLLTTRKRVSTLIAVLIGLVIGLVATYSIGRVIDLLVDLYEVRNPSLVATTKTLVGIALSYLAIITVLQTRDDFRLVIPYVEFAKQLRGARPLILDSSALIDARIGDLAGTGILQAPIIVPRFVVGELQLLADAADKLKRARGRRGLDLIVKLQRMPGLDVSIDESPMPGMGVDQMLVELARGMQGVIVTTDTALARVAGIQGVRTISLNDVAAAVKPTLVAGEQLALRIVKAGEQPTQGVGYLDDGTMVVVEDGRAAVGTIANLTVVSTLQTAGGRLVFARIGASDLGPGSAPGPSAEPTPASPTTPAEVPTPAPAGVEPAPSGPRSDQPDARSGDQGPSGDSDPREPDPPRGPFPPKPPSKRFNSLRNPRR